MNNNIFVIAEHYKNGIPDIVSEMLGQARKLVEISGGEVTAVLPTCEPENLAPRLAGAHRVICIKDESLRHYSPESWLSAIEPILRDATPGLVMVGSTSMGLDLAAALSTRLAIPMVSACIDLHLYDDTYHFTSQLYGGKLLLDLRSDAAMVIVQVLPGAFKPAEPEAGVNTHIEVVELSNRSEPLRMQFETFIEPDSSDIDITLSEVLVSVGRGIETKDNLSIAEDLAALLHGTVSASRPIIDQNWLPITRQVGKSGMTVKPKLYFALGISGAPEHLEGMKGAEMIVGINKDPDAPIFSIAHYGVVADMFDILPVLAEKLREARR
jgi:electron transfer flavoprotein alpha subunit